MRYTRLLLWIKHKLGLTEVSRGVWSVESEFCPNCGQEHPLPFKGDGKTYPRLCNLCLFNDEYQLQEQAKARGLW